MWTGTVSSYSARNVLITVLKKHFDIILFLIVRSFTTLIEHVFDYVTSHDKKSYMPLYKVGILCPHL